MREAAEPVAETLIAAPTSQTIRTALCVEAREGRMHVFMPPMARLEDYLNLVEAIEDTAEELAMPVMIEGYTPPWDHRLQHFKVTPDPGVIEVNLQPSANWQELVGNTTTLYDEARRSRLGTEKFMLDGRHTGTGGGNHIVLGRGKADRQPVPAPSRSAAEPGGLLEQPAVAVLFVLRPVRRPHEPGPAGGRGPPRESLRIGDGLHADCRKAPRRRGWSIASSAICWWT